MGRRKRTTEELETRRAQITQAAAKIFVSEGYHGATMEAIAEASGCSAATLYSYFTSKQDIFTGVLEDLAREVLAILQTPRPAGMSTRASLSWTADHMLDFSNRNRELILIYLIHTPTIICHPKYEKLQNAFMSYYCQIFEKGIELKEIREDMQPIQLALAYDGIMASFGFSRLLTGETIQKESYEPLIDLFLEGAKK